MVQYAMDKQCGKCKQTKPLAEFKSWRPKSKPEKTRYQSYCMDCARSYDKEYRARNVDKIKAYRVENKDRARQQDKNRARGRTLAKYGLTEEKIEQMKTAQAGACMICGKIPDDTLVVDHCHETGKVRGLLCRVHNAALGAFEDDPMMLLNAIEYLKLSRQGE